MLRMVARLRRRARTMPCKSPLISVTAALSMATSAPVPIAMPTCACASAGASLMLKRLDRACLLIGQHLGDHLVDAELAADRLGGHAAVAGQHHNADSVG